MTGKTIIEAKKIFDDFQAMLLNEAELTESLGKLSVLQGVAEFPSRIKCATLAWHAFIAALNNNSQVSTE
jgi:nitrogen fixation NifU-like protein